MKEKSEDRTIKLWESHRVAFYDWIEPTRTMLWSFYLMIATFTAGMGCFAFFAFLNLYP